MDQAFTLEITQQSAIITFDTPESKVNILSSEALYELELILKDIKSKPLKSLVIKSNKKNNFIAGANIKEIRSLKNEDEAYDKVRSGQQILSLISALPYPTIAVIDGVCLGGGFELALCCDYRIVTDNAKLGLPEVNLGVLPGFGGTQRLPKLTGMTKALELILSGKTIDGKKAYKYGIADAYIPSGYLEFELNEFLNNIPSKRNIKLGIFDKYFPNLVLAIANKKMLAKTKGAYPAPKEIIRVLKETRKSNINEGLDIEATSFAKLCVGNISKNLIELFFINEELKNDQGTTEENIELKEIKQSVVVGGGVMGAGIVWLFSKIGLFVRLKEINNVQIASSLKNVNKIYSYLLKRRKLTKAQISMNMNKISYTTDYSGFKNADLVVEAIVEDLNIKRKVYSEIEENTKPDCIIASNTSSLKISDLASELKHPQRFIGIHFFNPVNRMPLVEIVPGKETSAWTIANSVNIIKKSKKTPIVVGDCAGFLVNRVLFPYINEAAKLFEEGASIEQIDKIALDFGMPMGPFRLLDTVGIDVGYKVAHTLEEAYGSRMSSSKILETIYKDMNLLGEKSKKGFYIYENKKPVLNMDVENLITEKKEFTKEEIQERLIYVMINEASMTLEENIVKNHRQLDMAMIMGIGFPPYRGGLLRYADSIGLDTVLTSLSKLESKYGNRFKASELLISMSKQNKTFYN